MKGTLRKKNLVSILYPNLFLYLTVCYLNDKKVFSSSLNLPFQFHHCLARLHQCCFNALSYSQVGSITKTDLCRLTSPVHPIASNIKAHCRSK